MDAMDIQLVESKLCDVTVTPIPMNSTKSSHYYNHHSTSFQEHLQHQLPQIQITASHNNNHHHHHQQQQQQQQQLNQKSQQQNFSQLNTPAAVLITQTSSNITTPLTSAANIPSSLSNIQGLSKYAQLLAVIEEMGRDIRPTYTGSRSSTERLKRGIVHARILVRECLMETERSAMK